MTTPARLDDQPAVLNEKGEFQVEDEAIDLSVYAIEEWLGFGVFCVLGATVFHQFFTRYALNDSAAWTEEIARYLLMTVTFVGGGMAVRKVTHIHVEFLYVYMPRNVARAASMLVEAIRIGFFAYATYLSWFVTQIMLNQRMVVIDVPMAWIYAPCMIGLGIMTLRSIQVALRHWREGDSPLTRVSVEGRHQ